MSVNDRLMKAFEEYGGLTLNERIYHFLGSLGFTNSLSDRLAKYTSGRYRGYRALIEDFGRSSQPWEDLFAEGQTLHFDFIKQRYGVRVPESLTLVAGDSINGVGYVSEELAAAAGDPELATGSISDQPVSGFNLLGLEFTDAGSMTQLGVYFQGDVEESLAGIRVWVDGVEIEGPPSALLYDVDLDVTVVAYANPNMEPWVDGGQYNIGITLDGNEPSTIIDYTTNVNDLGIVTRASTATYWGPSGTLLEAAVDEARIQHDPVTGEPLGVLVESEATNVFANSYFGNGTRGRWSAQNGGISSFVEDDTAFGGYVAVLNVRGEIYQGVGGVLKPNTHFSARVRVAQGGPQTLTPTIRYGGSSDPSHTFTIPGDGEWHFISVELVGSGGNNNLIFGGATEGVLEIDWLQAVDGPRSSTYIPTIDSPVTRAEDYFGLNMGDKASSTGGTFRVTAQVPEGELVMLISSQASGFLTLYSDSDEMKTYTLSHPEDVVSFSLGYGIHQSLEYFPEAQS